MREFYGSSVKDFFETKGKRFIALPAVRRHLPKAGKGERLLDVGCGMGAYYDLVTKKGYKYYGLDASHDMLVRAGDEHPQGGFIVGKADRFAKVFKGKFDAILISMVFPSISSKQEMSAILKECKKVMKHGRPLLLVVSHPAYDHYMQAGLLGRKNVQTHFAGYFASGTKYKTQRRTETKCFMYEDYHWTIADYLDVLQKAGFALTALDECMPGADAKRADKVFYEKRMTKPTYLLLQATIV